VHDSHRPAIRSGTAAAISYFFSVVLVVLVPSLCWVVVLLLDWPVAGFEVELLLLDWPADGLEVEELVVF